MVDVHGAQPRPRRRIGQHRQRVQQHRGIEATRVGDTKTRGRPRQPAEQPVEPARDLRGLEGLACGSCCLHCARLAGPRPQATHPPDW